VLERLIAIGVVAAVLFGIASALKEHNDPQPSSSSANSTAGQPPAAKPSPSQPAPPPGPAPTHGKHDGKKGPIPLLPGLLAPLGGGDK